MFHLSLLRVDDPKAYEKLGNLWNTGDLYGPADNRAEFTLEPPSQIGKIRDGLPSQGEVGSRILWWWMSERTKPDPKMRAKALAAKLEKKLAQTKRTADGPSRIIIADVPEGRDADIENKLIAKAVQNAIVPKHKNIAGIILNNRVWL